ncbi:EmrB/QacA subfamily drug resistance transporter [Streptomyces sp. SAI-135]|jgi:EmrB/QacA subfamily drug resistance transporter|uniref:MFS transporter n=1 Tax=unclassified Streptomyces TaxID=2593676 RepID=UPI002473D295|nr:MULTISPECIES: MFS transporter [unclassified Streptomyces]MDH6519919.1 EmrB/QacA subfamily drug resistance transporter [Streptomyces sp. SAI-090]MDH6571221.1 EmrB/QacA subfamily drug resistance transporter [Streptomyces sp. SAI-117]MDH6615987.1 EmrB/QacA subfamily drug resistance transporter [Streptomyces sp. SAI-135]
MSTPSTTTASPSAPPDRTGHLGTTLLVVVTAYLMVGVDSTVVNVALPDIQRDLGFSPTGLSWVLNSYTLAFGGLLLLGGRAGDIAGRRRTLLNGVLLFAGSSLLGGLAGDSAWLLAARALQGVGAALVAPSTLALITTHFPEGPRRHHALSVYSATAGIGASVGLVLGGMLTDWASWRWALLINVPIGLAVAVALPRFVAETPRHAGRFDLAGALTGTAGTASLVYAFIRVSEAGWSDPRTLLGFSTAAALLTGFTLVESRAGQPVLPLRLFADRDRAGAYAGVMLLPAGMFGAFYFLTLISQQVLQYSPLRAGLAFLPMTLAMFSTVRLVPRLLGRLGAKPVLLTGTALVTGACAWLWRLDPGAGYLSGLLGPLLLLGVGIGLSLMPLNATILARVEPHEAGAASGLLQTLQWLGGTLGLSLLVTVYGTATRHATGSPSEVLVEGSARAFGVGALIAVTALLVCGTVIRGARPKGGS